MKNLTVDIGNSRIKAGIFNEKDLVEVKEFALEQTSSLVDFARTNPIDHVIISSVSIIPESLMRYINNKKIQYIELSANTSMPIKNLYNSNSTLGIDRLAAAAGANGFYPDQPLLIADLGSAITIDLVTGNNEFFGGNISPGMKMRFEALHEKTKRLPLMKAEEDRQDLLSQDTEAAIINGVQNSIVFEIDQYREQLKNSYKYLKTIITGGDAHFFEKRLKNTIFVNHLNLYGLNRILRHNAT